MIAPVCYCVFLNSFTVFHLLLWGKKQFGDLFFHHPMLFSATDGFLLFDSILETNYSFTFDVVSPLWWAKDHHYCLCSVYILLSRGFILVAALGDVSQVIMAENSRGVCAWHNARLEFSILPSREQTRSHHSHLFPHHLPCTENVFSW